MTNPTESKPLTSPWELLRDICSWLPHRDEARALAIVERHQQLHATEEMRRFFDEQTQELRR